MKLIGIKYKSLYYMFISNKKSIDYECNLEHITNCICTWGIDAI